MLYHSIAALFFATTALAEVVTLSTPYPFLNIAYGVENNIAISTVGTSDHTTTYNVQCATATALGCAFPTTGATVVDDPSSIALTYSMDQVTYTVGCAPATITSTSSLATCSETMYGSGIATMSGITSISAVMTWPEDVMRMFATGTQGSAWTVTIPTGIDLSSAATATPTVATATSTSGALKGLEAPRLSLFGIAGGLFALAF